MCRYGSIEPDPDNPQQSYLDYVESFPLNAEPEVSAPPTPYYTSRATVRVAIRVVFSAQTPPPSTIETEELVPKRSIYNTYQVTNNLQNVRFDDFPLSHAALY